jgi:hypothetical protein
MTNICRSSGQFQKFYVTDIATQVNDIVQQKGNLPVKAMEADTNRQVKQKLIVYVFLNIC